MRRTRDNWLVTPEPRHKEISSLRIFNGEDLHFHERRKSMMEVQRKWLDLQMKEINDKKVKDKQEKKLFDFQSFRINQAQSEVWDKKEEIKRKDRVSTREFNKRLASQSRERKISEKRQKALLELEELDYLRDARNLGPYVNPLKDY